MHVRITRYTSARERRGQRPTLAPHSRERFRVRQIIYIYARPRLLERERERMHAYGALMLSENAATGRMLMLSLPPRTSGRFNARARVCRLLRNVQTRCRSIIMGIILVTDMYVGTVYVRRNVFSLRRNFGVIIC